MRAGERTQTLEWASAGRTEAPGHDEFPQDRGGLQGPAAVAILHREHARTHPPCAVNAAGRQLETVAGYVPTTPAATAGRPGGPTCRRSSRKPLGSIPATCRVTPKCPVVRGEARRHRRGLARHNANSRASTWCSARTNRQPRRRVRASPQRAPPTGTPSIAQRTSPCATWPTFSAGRARATAGRTAPTRGPSAGSASATHCAADTARAGRRSGTDLHLRCARRRRPAYAHPQFPDEPGGHRGWPRRLPGHPALTDARVKEFGAYFQAVLADELRGLGIQVGYDANEQAVVIARSRKMSSWRSASATGKSSTRPSVRRKPGPGLG